MPSDAPLPSVTSNMVPPFKAVAAMVASKKSSLPSVGVPLSLHGPSISWPIVNSQSVEQEVLLNAREVTQALSWQSVKSNMLSCPLAGMPHTSTTVS